MTPSSAAPSSGPRPFDPQLRPLTAVEARVLGTLMEKARTVPDSYPLSLQALLTGCNQKTAREPVMSLSEEEVLAALEGLRELALVVEHSGARVARFGHNVQRALGVPEQSATLLGLLMLRGPQTAAELRLNAERWYRFADTSSVEAFLDELAQRSAEKGGPLVVQLPRAAGERERRWAHLLSGPPAAAASSAPAHPSEGSPLQTLTERVQALQTRVEQLEQTLERICQELGLPAPERDPAP